MNEELKQYEQDLFKKYQAGTPGARRDLLKSLAPVINSQAGRFSGSGLPDIAVKLEGQRLALEAFKTYDPSKSQLNTHVTNSLKKLSRFVTNYQNVGHIPEPRALMIGKYNVIYENLKNDIGREPTPTELADAMQIPEIEIDRLQSELRNDLSTSLQESDEDNPSGFYQYIIPGETDPKLKEAIDFVYFDSDVTDKKILDMSLGLHNTPKLLSKDIATKLNLSDSELKTRKSKLAEEIRRLT